MMLVGEITETLQIDQALGTSPSQSFGGQSRHSALEGLQNLLNFAIPNISP